MSTDVRRMFERMAENGTAPDEGCVLFGVGYDDAFDRLKKKYLIERFARGDSSEKFVVGPFGSGKTHFLRQLMEIAREIGCVTAEVKLDKNIDFTNSLQVYQEVANQLRPPTGGRGVSGLLRAITERIAEVADDEATRMELILGFAEALDLDDNLELPVFARVAQTAFRSIAEGNQARLESAERWLSGEVENKDVCKELGVTRIPKNQQPHHGSKALLSLFQLIKKAGYAGTVVCFDESEQGLEANKQKTARILSMFQSGINAIADLRGGAAFIAYALTADLFNKMTQYPALQQRVDDPIPGRDFIDGDTFAPRIDLSNRRDPQRDLTAIAQRLVALLYSDEGQNMTIPETEALARAEQIVAEVLEREAGSGNRRTLVKRLCSTLLEAHGAGPVTPSAAVEAEV